MFEDDLKEPKYSEERRFFATSFLVLQIGMTAFLIWYFVTHSWKKLNAKKPIRMEILNFFRDVSDTEMKKPFEIKREAILNMAGVVLFYVIVFVAFSVFSVWTV